MEPSNGNQLAVEPAERFQIHPNQTTEMIVRVLQGRQKMPQKKGVTSSTNKKGHIRASFFGQPLLW